MNYPDVYFHGGLVRFLSQRRLLGRIAVGLPSTYAFRRAPPMIPDPRTMSLQARSKQPWRIVTVACVRTSSGQQALRAFVERMRKETECFIDLRMHGECMELRTIKCNAESVGQALEKHLCAAVGQDEVCCRFANCLETCIFARFEELHCPIAAARFMNREFLDA